jgi:hypothetical protein
VYSRSYPSGIVPTDKTAYEEFRKAKLSFACTGEATSRTRIGLT